MWCITVHTTRRFKKDLTVKSTGSSPQRFYSKIFAIYSNRELKADKVKVRDLVSSLNVDIMTKWAKSTIIRDAMASRF